MQRFAQEVLCCVSTSDTQSTRKRRYQTMQVMETFNIGRETTAIILANLHLFRPQPSLASFIHRDDDTPI
jgi:hypothetical protein